MRIVFMGTPEFAAGILAVLYQAGYELPLVVTQPDHLSGRGKKQVDSPTKAFAVKHGLAVFQPGSVRENEAIQRIKDAKPDAIVVAAYGKLLPAILLNTAPLGCINVHASLLPAYRGAAPIQWALLNGEKETGVTIIKLDEGLDTGSILSREKMRIPGGMDFGGLYQALMTLGGRLLLETLPSWAAGKLILHPQPEGGASYAPRLQRSDEIIDWDNSAHDIGNRISAFSPSPGASTRFQMKEVKIIAARVTTNEDMDELATQNNTNIISVSSKNKGLFDPGQIIGILRRQGPVVATGNGSLLLTRIQPTGKKPMDGWDWLNGSRAKPGQLFMGASENSRLSDSHDIENM